MCDFDMRPSLVEVEVITPGCARSSFLQAPKGRSRGKKGQWHLGSKSPGGIRAYVFGISRWSWDEHLWIDAISTSDGKLAGFGLLLMLSDGQKTDSVEVWEAKGRQGIMLKEKQEWIIPRRHPTRELALISHGEQTTQVLRKLEQCFRYEPHDHPALPDKTATVCNLVVLRGIVDPDEGRFTARMKVLFPENDGQPYGEFFLNVNSINRLIWVSEKASEYRSAILTRFSNLSGVRPPSS